MRRSKFTLLPALLGILLACSTESNDDPSASILRFESSASQVQAGETFTLSWATSGAISFELTGQDDTAIEVDESAWEEGSLDFTLEQTTTFVLAISGSDGKEITRDLVVEVGDPPAEELAATLRVQPAKIAFGEQVVLTWTTQNAIQVLLSDEDGIIPGSEGSANGELTLEPTKNTVYTLVASAGDEEITRTATVEVGPAILEFEVVTEGGFNPGDVVEFRWKTGAGLEATLSTSEDSLEIPEGEVAEGSASIEIGGNGKVTLEVRNGDLVTTQTLNLPLLS